MAQFEKWFTQDLTQNIELRHCESIVFTNDNLSNVVGVNLFVNGAEYSGGGTVTASVVRSDGATVALSGTLDGNKASVTLTSGCFGVPGLIGVYIRLNDGDTKTTVLSAVFTVIQSETDSAVDPGTIIPSVQELIDEIEDAVNSIPADYSQLLASIAPTFSTSTAYSKGAYVWQEGILYKFTQAHSAGAWTGTDATTVVIGDVLSSTASLIPDGTAFSQATQGGTTYDVQDARVAPLDILSNGLCGLDAYGVAGTKTNNGYTFTKGIGNRVKINGQYGGGSYFSVAMGNGIKVTTSSTLPDTFVHFALQKGHSYRITAQYVSGEILYDSYDCVLRYYQKTGSGAAVAVQLTSALYADIANGKTVWTRYILADATETTLFGYGFYIRGNKITNLVIDFTLEDVTSENLAYQISGATPNIVAAAGSRYICSAAYVTSLSFTPSATGICSVRFTSGTTPTVLTLPNTVKMPDWWTGTEANRTYEISIEDGVYGAVTSWA